MFYPICLFTVWTRDAHLSTYAMFCSLPLLWRLQVLLSLHAEASSPSCGETSPLPHLSVILHSLLPSVNTSFVLNIKIFYLLPSLNPWRCVRKNEIEVLLCLMRTGAEKPSKCLLSRNAPPTGTLFSEKPWFSQPFVRHFCVWHTYKLLRLVSPIWSNCLFLCP